MSHPWLLPAGSAAAGIVWGWLLVQVGSPAGWRWRLVLLAVSLTALAPLHLETGSGPMLILGTLGGGTLHGLLRLGLTAGQRRSGNRPGDPA